MKKVLLALAALLVTPAIAHAQAATITNNIPPPPSGLICVGSATLTTPGEGFVYFFSSPAPGGQFTYSLGGSPCSGTTLNFTVGGGHSSAGEFHAYQGLYGGPNSAQFLTAQTLLDLDDIQPEGEARFADAGTFDLEGDADTIGYAGTYFDAPGVDGYKHELRYAKAWRPFEGQRTRALFNGAAQAVLVNDNSNFNGLLSAGIEIPAQPNWSLTPRLSLAASSGDDFFGGDGYVGTVSLASRYRIAQLGRGDLVIGNAIAFTAESEFDTQNVLLRNGVAYQFPLQQRMFGRQSTLRASYTHTQIEGDPVGIDTYHEVAMNLGVRLREGEARSRFELFRVGFIYTAADLDYQAGTLTLGYRF